MTLGPHTVSCHPDRLPNLYREYVEHAELSDEFDLRGSDEGRVCFVAVSRAGEWPFLVVALRYRSASGFHPGALLVPETDRLFIGAGEHLLAYRLDIPNRLWIDHTAGGFWAWAQHEDRIILSAELELAAWDLNGNKCWSLCVEPPWEYKVVADTIELDVMGTKSSFPVHSGPLVGPA